MLRKLSFLIGLAVVFLFLSVEVQSPARAEAPRQGASLEGEQDSRFTEYDPSKRTFMPSGEMPNRNELEGVWDILPIPYSKIVFEDYDFGEWDIFIADGGFKNPRRIAAHSAVDTHPELNRGATKIVFASDRTGNFDIYSINVDGSALTQLTANATDDVNPSWSPDGTRIVFEAYRDGQPEIYVMNADGSNQTKLTWDFDYDGMPTWSPDGKKIAFVSRRAGGYRVWTMNADGSGQAQLTDKPYSFHPAWSPDGRMIAFDADSNFDGFQEAYIYLIDENSSSSVSELRYKNDYLINGFSPDLTLLSYTKVEWIYSDGNWYWLQTQPLAKVMQGYNEYWMSLPGTVWFLDWKSIDYMPPTSTLSPVNEVSPYQLRLSWRGVDDHPELPYYEVQVKDGINGLWTNVFTDTTEISGIYTGVGGQDLYFRLRARDTNYNYEAWPEDYEAHTRIESDPPITIFSPAPRFYQDFVTLNWSATDPGSSGIKSYSLQKCNESEGCIWNSVNIYPSETSYDFYYGRAGNTYRFRVRAMDNAENIQDWEDADTLITAHYSWRVKGLIADNMGVPLPGSLAELSSGYLGSELSDLTGSYSAYGGPGYLTSTVTWNKDGYLPLPTTLINASHDQVADEYLPPANNIINDWGFEGGGFENSGWYKGGNITPTLTQIYRHTGSQGAFLGVDPDFIPKTVVNVAGGWILRDTIMDSSGSVHFLWSDEDPGILYYRRLNPDGSWTTPYLVALYGGYTGTMRAAPDNTIHVFWEQDDKLFHVSKYSDDTWTSHESISGEDLVDNQKPCVDFDSNGGIHVAWRYLDGAQKIHYAVNENGIWSPPELITEDSSSDCRISVDSSDRIHILWRSMTSGGLNHTWRTLDDPWNPPTTIDNEINENSQNIYPGSDGSILVTWTNDSSNFYYRRRSSSGEWSDSHVIQGASHPRLAIVGEQVYSFWMNGTRLYYSLLQPDGEWGEYVGLDANYIVTDFNVSVYPQGTPYIGINYKQWGIDNKLGYTFIDQDGQWALPIHIRTEINNFKIRYVLAKNSETLASIYQYTFDIKTIIYTGADLTVPYDGDSMLSTSFTIPDNIEYPVLSYLYNLWCPDAALGSKFEVTISSASITETLTNTAASTAGWQHAWHALESWKGQSAGLNFEIQQAAGDQACRAVIDEVTVGSAYPDLWAAMDVAERVRPGETIEYHIQAGNRGGAPASSSALTLTLPVEMTFISSDLEPASAGETIVWDLGMLPGKSEPISITVTARLESMPESGYYLSSSIAIGSGTSEIETHNNLVQASSYAGLNTYLPLIGE